MRLWSVSRKVEGRYLLLWLKELDGTTPGTEVDEARNRVAVDGPLDDRILSLHPHSPT